MTLKSVYGAPNNIKFTKPVYALDIAPTTGRPGGLVWIEPFAGFYIFHGMGGFYHLPGWWQRLHHWVFGRYWGDGGSSI